MAPVIPNPDKIRAFETEAEFEAWMARNHDQETEIWVQYYKKASGRRTVVYAQALDVALCYGWIDGISKPVDEHAYLQRFTPRKAKSIWSQRNRLKVEKLIADGRMTAHGQKQIDAAKADGRWDKAYASPGKMETPPDLLAAIEANPAAYETFNKLNATNRYALAFRTHNMKTEAGRKKKIAGFVEMLARGEAPYPQKFAEKG
ncbi:YdeI/OmpD-associated family protein [Paradevosia shaoguanensis]|uniref:YdeI/OmpD-associated family protein n=1 Tax=Paradevosia shaoguanensis TaxID=1335043 RepID=UPI003C7968F6